MYLMKTTQDTARTFPGRFLLFEYDRYDRNAVERLQGRPFSKLSTARESFQRTPWRAGHILDCVTGAVTRV